jgi:ABC-type branched-subunit amino acid transport system ATPase component
VLTLRQVSSGYPSLPVLFDVSLEVPSGALVSVLGGNGAGKSTLLKTILGDVPTTAGEITFDGRRLTRAPLHARTAAGIGYCPEGRRIFPNLTTEENLVAGSCGVRARDLPHRLDAVYDLFPLLRDRRTQPAGSLSGGEQQMLAVGRALMPGPKLLMVEELSLGLAPLAVTHLYEALRALCAGGLAVLVAEQSHRFEARYSDGWIVLERGTVTKRSAMVVPPPTAEDDGMLSEIAET